MINAVHARRHIARLIAAAAGALAAGALALPGAASAAHISYSAGQLAATSDAVERTGVAGIAWHAAATTGRVVVTADSSVSDAALAKIRHSSGTVRIERAAGVFSPLLSAGAAIYGGQYRCSLGFNVISGSTY